MLPVLAWAIAALASSPSLAVPPRGLALRGALATPETRIPEGVLLIRDGAVECAGACEVPEGYAVLETSGVILPGLVDPHNHPDWNIHPRDLWPLTTTYEDRHQWRLKDPAYRRFSRAHYAVFEDTAGARDHEARHLATWRADVQALLGGVTTLTGGSRGYGPGLARSPLEDDRFGPQNRPVCDTVFPLDDLDPSKDEPGNPAWEKKKAFLLGLRDCFADRRPKEEGPPKRLIVHLAEGFTSSSTLELPALKSLLPAGEIPEDRLTAIHGLGLSPGHLDELAASRAYLVWSPVSNLNLYGRTLDVREALRRGVRLALGADWAMSGSPTLLQEIAAARDWLGDVPLREGQTWPNEKELALMATSEASGAVGLADQLGRLAPGYRADVLVLRPRDPALREDPYLALASAGEEEVALVLVDGVPLHGDPDLLRGAGVPVEACEPLTVCGAPKEFCAKGLRFPPPFKAGLSLSEVDGLLGARLESRVGEPFRALAPLEACR